jgi:DNA-binding winged helix-turn-helix (wHTH) protein
MNSIRCEILTKIGAGELGRTGYADILLDSRQKLLKGTVSSVKLTKSEFLALWLIIRAQGSLITKDEITYILYEEFSCDSEMDIPLGNSVEVFITRLRRKIVCVTHSAQIELLRGYGYKISKCPNNVQKHIIPMSRESSAGWTFDTVSAEAKKYQNRSSFQRCCSAAYMFAWRNGWLDQLFPKSITTCKYVLFFVGDYNFGTML